VRSPNRSNAIALSSVAWGKGAIATHVLKQKEAIQHLQNTYEISDSGDAHPSSPTSFGHVPTGVDSSSEERSLLDRQALAQLIGFYLHPRQNDPSMTDDADETTQHPVG
jgi:hypothetical protein